MGTQLELVMDYTKEKGTVGIRETAKRLGIKEPNVRRILGQGTRKNIFERVGRGAYRLYKNNEVVLYLRLGSALTCLSDLEKKGFKSDMIFLDIPYRTPATVGGNRPMKFDTIEPAEFKEIMELISTIIRNDDSALYYMFSQATSGWKKMEKYNQILFDVGFQLVDVGGYWKTYHSGKPIVNVCGEVAKPEGMWLLTKSGNFLDKSQRNLKFILKRPNTSFKTGGYPTQKPISLYRSLINQSTHEDDIITDPFLGGGKIAEACFEMNRRFVGIDISEKSINDRVIPNLKERFKYER